MNPLRMLPCAVLWIVFVQSASAAGAQALPVPLELRYSLHYGMLTVGHVTKTLTQDARGIYQARSRSVPEGMARWFTEVEWFEEGEFEIRQGQIRPLRFLEYRVGADKSHRHEAFFDWAAGKVRYYNKRIAVDLPAGTQDSGSLFYSFMLSPPAPGSTSTVHLSSGKKLRSYKYAETGQETLNTPFGRLKTRVIERVDQSQVEEGLKVWLALDYQNLPVRVATIKRGETTTLDLEKVSGALKLPIQSK